MIFVKNSNFFHCLFLLKIGPEMMFADVLDRKEAFLDNKNMCLISPKNRKFSKGVNQWFWSKIPTFFIFFLLKIGPEMMFADVLVRKEAFVDNKNTFLICLKNRKFSKGVNPWFRSKIRTFVIVCFYWKRAQKWCLGMF